MVEARVAITPDGGEMALRIRTAGDHVRDVLRTDPSGRRLEVRRFGRSAMTFQRATEPEAVVRDPYGLRLVARPAERDLGVRRAAPAGGVPGIDERAVRRGREETGGCLAAKTAPADPPAATAIGGGRSGRSKSSACATSKCCPRYERVPPRQSRRRISIDSASISRRTAGAGQRRPRTCSFNCSPVPSRASVARRSGRRASPQPARRSPGGSGGTDR